jgi:hypothetical protein
MSLDLVDVRFKLPADLNAVLDAIAEAQGREKSAIARQFVEDALNKQLHLVRCVNYELSAIGLQKIVGDFEGKSGRK